MVALCTCQPPLSPNWCSTASAILQAAVEARSAHLEQELADLRARQQHTPEAEMALQLADARHALKHAEERAACALAAKACYKEQVG